MHESDVHGSLHKIVKFMASGSRVQYGHIVDMNLILENMFLYMHRGKILTDNKVLIFMSSPT